MKYTVQIEARHATSPHLYAVVRVVEVDTAAEARKLIAEAIARFGVVPTVTDEKGRKMWLLTDAEVAHIKPVNLPEADIREGCPPDGVELLRAAAGFAGMIEPDMVRPTLFEQTEHDDGSDLA